MNDASKTKEQLVTELAQARARIAELETSKAEHERAQEALYQIEERYRAVAGSEVTGIGITDPEENFIFVNPAFSRMLGYAQDELIGTNLSQLAVPEEFAKYQDQTTERMDGEHSHYETALRRKDGSILNILISASPLTASDGSFQGTLGVIVDITERKRAEESLQEAYEDVERQVEERTAALMREIAERKRLEEAQERLKQEIVAAQRRALL